MCKFRDEAGCGIRNRMMRMKMKNGANRKALQKAENLCTN